MKNVPALYLKGTFNGWGLDTPFCKQSSTLYSANVVFSADQHQFKITDMDGTEQWTFSGHKTETTELPLNEQTVLLTTQGIGNDLTFTPNKTGRFTLLLDISGATPRLTIESGVNTTKPKPSRNFIRSQLNGNLSETSPINAVDWALEPEILFQTLAIESSNSFPFVFGDNVDGYYEGQTHCFVGSGRYRHHQGWYLGGFSSWVDGKLNDKSEANCARLMPYGIEHLFDDSTDLLCVHNQKRIVSLSVTSDKGRYLGLLPELNLGTNDVTVEYHNDVLLLCVEPTHCPEGCPSYIAISANQPVLLEEVTFDQYPELEDTLFLSPENCHLMVTSCQPSQELTAYICFEHDKENALELARQAAVDNALQLHKIKTYEFLTRNYLWTNDLEYNRALMWARLSSRVFVSHEFGTGIWAGLPWFKDCWGRDTFIALSGTSLINGEFSEAKSIIDNFSTMQMQDKQSVNYGRIPNRVTSKTNIIYNTTDGTPWMVREILEYINYSGDLAFASSIYPVVQRFIEGIEANYLDDDGLICHRHPDTWMDAKINGQLPWSPRGPKANDIQALWYESLNVAQQLAMLNGDKAFENHVSQLALQAKRSFILKFWDEPHLLLADRLEANERADYSLRPNQLMTLTIPQSHDLIEPRVGQYIVKNCVDNLLFPWGICSLDQNHPEFHPYHDNRTEYHKDAAYHNGTIWGWNAGFTVSALTQFDQQEFAYQLSKNLACQILYQGHRGTMSENLDAFQNDMERLVQTGTYAQAWSVSEFARNAQQDYLGFKPELINNQISLTPKIPPQWTDFVAQLPFARENALRLEFKRDSESAKYVITPKLASAYIQLKIELTHEDKVISVKSDLTQPIEIVIEFATGHCRVSPSHITETRSPARIYPALTNLTFATPEWTKSYPALEEHDYLLGKRQKQQLQIDKDTV